MAEDNQQPAAVFNSNQNKSPTKRKWSDRKIVTVVLGSIVVVVIVLFVLFSAATSAPVKVSNDLVADIQAGNSAMAYSLMSSAAKEATPENDFNSALARISPILTGKPDMQSKEISGETGSSATAKVVYKIHGTDGINYNFTVNLTKENGEWKVLNFESTK